MLDSALAPPIEAGAEFDVATLVGTTTAVGDAPHRGGLETGPAWTIELTPGLLGYGSGVGVSGGMELLPQPVRILDPASPDYAADARATLAGLGLVDAPVLVTQAVAVDLDGDSVEEVVFAAQHPDLETYGDHVLGGYSILVVRRDSALEPYLLYASAFTEKDFGQATSVFTAGLNAVADLNGDRRMEIVVDGFYYEGVFSAVYEYDPRTPQPDPVLLCGQGA